MSLFNVNQVTLLGNITQQKELKQGNSGTSIYNFTVVTNHSIKRNDEWIQEATFHDVVTFGKSAEFVSELEKGTKVFVQGRLQKRSYENKNGQTVYITEIIAEKVIGLGSFNKSNNLDQVADDFMESMETKDENGPTPF